MLKKIGSLLEEKMLKTGIVLDVRAWEPATFFEVDLHLPYADMSKWNEVQHIKCRVSHFTYRDYTPAGWDAETKTCTLYINASQDSAGSRWVKSLSKGDVFTYLGIGPTPHRPVAGQKLTCLGDETAIGHFLALRQLAGETGRLDGAIALEQEAHCSQLKAYLPLQVDTLVKTDTGGQLALSRWLYKKQEAVTDSVVYLAGHIPTTDRLRRELKQMRFDRVNVKAQGFWS